MQGIFVSGDGNGQDKSAQLAPDATYNLFNASTFPAGGSNSLIPEEQYMWQVSCGCIIDSSLPFPDRLFGSNVHISPFSDFQFFTNLPLPQIAPEDETLDLLEKQIINIYPNPATDQLTLDLSTFSKFPSSISIINSNGKEVVAKDGNRKTGSQYQLPISHLQNGVYVIRVFSGGEIYQKSFIKQ